MNMADDVSGESSDSDEGEEGAGKAAQKDAAQIISEQLAAIEKPQSRGRNEFNQSTGSFSSKEALIESQKTPMGSIGYSDNKNQLPEDNEIIDEEEEEEDV